MDEKPVSVSPDEFEIELGCELINTTNLLHLTVESDDPITIVQYEDGVTYGFDVSNVKCTAEPDWEGQCSYQIWVKHKNGAVSAPTGPLVTNYKTVE